MDWYRRWHDADNDVKFTTIAKKIGLHVCFVKCVWESLITYASSRDDDRGSIEGVDLEDIATSNSLELDQVQAIHDAFVARKMISRERFTNWEKRQPESDVKGDFTSTERGRRFREKKRLEREETEEKQIENGYETGSKREANGPDQIRSENITKQTNNARPRKIILSDLKVDDLQDWLLQMKMRGKEITVDIDIALEQMKAHFGSSGGLDKNRNTVHDWVEKAKSWILEEQKKLTNQSNKGNYDNRTKNNSPSGNGNSLDDRLAKLLGKAASS